MTTKTISQTKYLPVDSCIGIIDIPITFNPDSVTLHLAGINKNFDTEAEAILWISQYIARK